MEENQYLNILESLVSNDDLSAVLKRTYLVLLLAGGGALGPVDLGISVAKWLVGQAGIENVESARIRLKRLTSAGVVELEGKTTIWVYHPSGNAREKKRKPCPLFDSLGPNDFYISGNPGEKTNKSDRTNPTGQISWKTKTTSEPQYITHVGARGFHQTKRNKTKNKESCFVSEDTGEIGPEECQLKKESGKLNAADSRKLADFQSPEVRRTREEVAATFAGSIRETKPIRPDLIDRVTAGIALGLPGFSLRMCRRIAEEAEQSKNEFHNSFFGGKRGREFLWQTINIRFCDLWKAAGGIWPETRPGIEPEPARRSRSNDGGGTDAASCRSKKRTTEEIERELSDCGITPEIDWGSTVEDILSEPRNVTKSRLGPERSFCVRSLCSEWRSIQKKQLD